MMRALLLTVSLLLLTFSAAAEEQDGIQYVIVAEPYIEMHTGPGAVFPVTQVIERGQEVGVIKRRTDWFLVRSPRGYEGWVFVDDLQKTLQPISGELVARPLSRRPSRRDRSSRARRSRSSRRYRESSTRSMWSPGHRWRRVTSSRR